MPRDTTPPVSRLPRKVQVGQLGQEKLFAVDPAGFSENVEASQKLLGCIEKLPVCPHDDNLYKFYRDCQELIVGSGKRE